MNRVDQFLKETRGIAEYGNIESSFDFFLHFNFKKNIEILDLGTNLGTFPYLLYKHGWKNCSGIDINETAINSGKVKYPEISDLLHIYDGKRLPYKENSIDVITCFDVIEHIKHVDIFLLEAHRVLKDKGFFIFQTPNKLVNSVWSSIQYKSFTTWKKEHCSLQTFFSLRKKLIDSGFHNISYSKHTINTDHNRKKVREKLGLFGLGTLKVADNLPLILYPNLWGFCSKADQHS